MTEMLAEICYDPNTGRGDPAKLQAALKLTFYQIREVLCASRDPKGNLIVEPKPDDGPTPEEKFTATWLRRGLARWRIKEMWQEELRMGALRAAALKGRR